MFIARHTKPFIRSDITVMSNQFTPFDINFSSHLCVSSNTYTYVYIFIFPCVVPIAHHTTHFHHHIRSSAFARYARQQCSRITNRYKFVCKWRHYRCARAQWIYAADHCGVHHRHHITIWCARVVARRVKNRRSARAQDASTLISRDARRAILWCPRARPSYTYRRSITFDESKPGRD